MNTVARLVNELSSHARGLSESLFVIYVNEDGSGGVAYPDNPMAYSIISSIFEAGVDYFKEVFPDAVWTKVRGGYVIIVGRVSKLVDLRGIKFIVSKQVKENGSPDRALRSIYDLLSKLNSL